MKLTSRKDHFDFTPTSFTNIIFIILPLKMRRNENISIKIDLVQCRVIPKSTESNPDYWKPMIM